MIIKEFRILMPVTIDEYQRGQIYAVAESAKRETGGGDGIEDIVSENFENIMLDDGRELKQGQYTQKKYHIDHKVPGFIRLLTPRGALDVKEESWNAFPYCKTILTNDYLGDRLNVIVESIHLPDRGETDNALGLTPEQLKVREVVIIDIGEELSPEEEANFADDEVPRRYRSTKSLRGPLGKNWSLDCQPVMTCYKLVTCEFKIFGLQSRLENFIQKNEKRIFTTFHRRMFCWMDNWFTLSLEECISYDACVSKELDQQRENGSLKGNFISN